MKLESPIPDNWQIVPFDDVIDFQEGPGILAKDFRQAGVPLIRLAGLQSNDSVTAGCNYLDPAMVDARWGHFRLRLGDTLLSTSASLGRIARVGSDGVGAIPYTGIIRLRPHDGRIHEDFIQYLLQSKHFMRQVEAAGVGSVIRHFGPSHLRTMHLVLPPIHEQRAIARILGTLDDKIELNRQMNRTLDELARTLFTSWFVHFDPVRAKAEGRQPEGVDMETAALFPDRLVASELGPIPEGWRVSSIGDEFNVTMGQSPPGSTYNETGDGLPFYQGRADFGFRFPAIRLYCTDPKRTAKAGDTLLSVRAPVGDLNVAREKCIIGRGVAALRHKCGSATYTFHALSSLATAFLTYDKEGTVFGSINQRDLKALPILAPSPEVIAAFIEQAEPLDDLLRSNFEESRTLAELRDTLLPKLLSGRARVPKAEIA